MEPEGSSPHSKQPAICSYPKPDRSSPCPPIQPLEDPFQYYFPFHTLVFYVVSLPQVSPLNACNHLFSPHTCYMSCPSQAPWLDHSNDIWWGVQSTKLLVMQSSPLPCYLEPLRSKCPPQRPTLEKPQPTLLPQHERPSFRLHTYSKPEDQYYRNIIGRHTEPISHVFFVLFTRTLLAFWTDIFLYIPTPLTKFLEVCCLYDKFAIHFDSLPTWTLSTMSVCPSVTKERKELFYEGWSLLSILLQKYKVCFMEHFITPWHTRPVALKSPNYDFDPVSKLSKF